MGILFPVFAVKFLDHDLGYRRWVQTSYIDTVSIWIRTGNIERLDSTSLTKKVFGGMGSEAVGGEVLFSAY